MPALGFSLIDLSCKTTFLKYTTVVFFIHALQLFMCKVIYSVQYS
jgi:hypothetical protein